MAGGGTPIGPAHAHDLYAAVARSARVCRRLIARHCGRLRRIALVVPPRKCIRNGLPAPSSGSHWQRLLRGSRPARVRRQPRRWAHGPKCQAISPARTCGLSAQGKLRKERRGCGDALPTRPCGSEFHAAPRMRRWLAAPRLRRWLAAPRLRRCFGNDAYAAGIRNGAMARGWRHSSSSPLGRMSLGFVMMPLMNC